ncbi:MAG: dCTP deaminase [Patescibacteria group bacterium]|jgi:dCTP deaminase|nr:dCTP deaminase [Patescibacteria group bacterium]
MFEKVNAQAYLELSERLKEALIGAPDDIDAVRAILENTARFFSGIAGDAEIVAAVNSGLFVIDPFEEMLLGSSSYDVRLGGNFWVAEQVGHKVDFSPYDEDEVRSYYSGPYQAVTHAQWCEDHQRHPFSGIADDEQIIVLKPGECILAHTLEFIGAVCGATTMMKARSSLGRINISACDDAGWGDVGYVNRWTMEVRNKNQEVWVPLVVGMPIAQLVFLWVAGSTINYGQGGHYQSGVDLARIKAEWNADSMLPRFFSHKNEKIRKLLRDNPDIAF